MSVMYSGDIILETFRKGMIKHIKYVHRMLKIDKYGPHFANRDDYKNHLKHRIQDCCTYILYEYKRVEHTLNGTTYRNEALEYNLTPIIDAITKYLEVAAVKRQIPALEAVVLVRETLEAKLDRTKLD